MSAIETMYPQATWESVARTFARVTDASGMPIDPEIMETVVALNALGIPTTMSCGGHIDEQRGLMLPWVDIEAPHPASKELKKEMARLEREAEQLQAEANQLRTSHAHWTLQKAAQDSANEKHWAAHIMVRRIRLLQCDARDKLISYLSQFYTAREVPFDRRLIIQMQTPLGKTRLLNQAAIDFYLAASIATQQQKLIECREEMQAFTSFLKTIYFSQQQETAPASLP